MTISVKLTQKELLEILTTTYLKGIENQSIRVVELIEEIKKQILDVEK